MKEQRTSFDTYRNSTLTNRERRTAKMKRLRTLQLRRRIAVSVLTIVIVICGAVSFGVLNSKAGNVSDNEILYKYYKTVEIQPEDTLWDFAKANYSSEKQTVQEYIAEVQNINHLEDDKLTAGYYIVLPYYSTEFVYY